jgi:hypothetical protein
MAGYTEAIVDPFAMARRTYKRDKIGRFASGGSSAPSGTVAKGGKGISGSVARSVASEGIAGPSSKGKTPRLKAKAGAKAVMKEGINSPIGSARAGFIKARAAERAASKEVSAAKKLKKGPARDQALGKALGKQDKAEKAFVKANDKLAKALRRK